MGPVEFLTAAHQRAEEIARAAREHEFCKDGHWIAMGPFGDDDRAIIQSKPGEEILGDSTDGLPWPYAALIVMHDPAAVLRRVTAERKILEAHQQVEGLGYTPDDPHEKYGEIASACSSCGKYDEYAERFPCPTVRALAEGWGWTGEQHG